MGRSKPFKSTVILLSNDLSISKDKIKNWIEFAGGQVSQELTDTVTHLVISRNKWNEYPLIVAEARRKQTVFIMKYKWLEDSLSAKSSRPLQEAKTKYTFEVKHAQRVSEAQKQLKLAARRAKKVASETDTNVGTLTDNHDDVDRNRTNIPPIESPQSAIYRLNTKTPPTPLTKPSAKVQKIIDCGIKLDKSLLETERNVALQGYRPYVDVDGLPYLVTLVRNDVAKKLKDQYDIKPHGPSSNHPSFLDVKENVKSSHDSLHICRDRFNSLIVSENICGHYLEAGACFLETSKFKNSVPRFGKNPHLSVPDDSALSGGLGLTSISISNSVCRQWDQHIPFSTYPVAEYDPSLPARDAEGIILPRRVHLPQPFAYALQLYESFDYREVQTLPQTALRSTITTNASFTSLLASSHSPSSSTITTSSHDHSSSLASECPQLYTERKYYLVSTLTRKGKSRSSHFQILAPMDSNWDFAYNMFCSTFKRKTGMDWENAKLRPHPTTSQGDFKAGCTKTITARTYDDRLPSDRSHSQMSTYMGSQQSKTTGTFGASFFDAALSATPRRDQFFQYVPNRAQDLKEIGDAYLERHHIPWLPSHVALENGHSVQGTGTYPANHNTISEGQGVRTWTQVTAQSKSRFEICNDHPDLDCNCA